MKLKIKTGNTHVKKMDEIVLDIRVKRVMEELVPMLLGISLLYGESPCQYLNSLRLNFTSKLLLILSKKGYIIGDETNWQFSKHVLDMVAANLKKLLPERAALSLQRGYSEPEPPMSLSGLRTHYCELLGKCPKEIIPAHGTRVIPHLRQLCRKYDSRFISENLEAFFNHAVRNDQDLSMDGLGRYLKNLTGK